MGEYAPEDVRKVHENAGPDKSVSDWHDKEKSEREREHEKDEQHKNEGARPGDQQQALDAETGTPRPKYDQYEVNQAGNTDKKAATHRQQEQQQQSQSGSGDAQRGYGNARDEDGEMEQDVADKKKGDEADIAESEAKPGEISDRPDERAAADANRPLGGS